MTPDPKLAALYKRVKHALPLAPERKAMPAYRHVALVDGCIAATDGQKLAYIPLKGEYDEIIEQVLKGVSPSTSSTSTTRALAVHEDGSLEPYASATGGRFCGIHLKNLISRDYPWSLTFDQDRLTATLKEARVLIGRKAEMEFVFDSDMDELTFSSEGWSYIFSFRGEATLRNYTRVNQLDFAPRRWKLPLDSLWKAVNSFSRSKGVTLEFPFKQNASNAPLRLKGHWDDLVNFVMPVRLTTIGGHSVCLTLA